VGLETAGKLVLETRIWIEIELENKIQIHLLLGIKIQNLLGKPSSTC
jgi:hypothetical protein